MSPLLAQSGHGPAYKSRINYWPLGQLTCLSSSNNIAHVDKLRVENEHTCDAVIATHELALALLLRTARGCKGRCDMCRCGDFRKFVAVALALGVVANAGGKPALAKARHLADTARPTAIHECNIEADKYSPITQLPNQFAVYGTCMTNHRQRFG